MSQEAKASPNTHVCPWWFIRAFDNPLRRLLQNPEHVLRDLVRAGDACLDLGCGIGYFTIPLARLVGPTGAVTAVDLQPQMLAGVRRRAEQSGLASRIRLHQADASSLLLDDTFDFALAFWMLHEVPDQGALLRAVRAVLLPHGRLALVEPKGHVRRAAFNRTVRTAESAGFVPVRELHVAFSRGVLMAAGGG